MPPLKNGAGVLHRARWTVRETGATGPVAEAILDLARTIDRTDRVRNADQRAAYRAAHPGEQRSYSRTSARLHYAAHPDEMRARSLAYAAAHREERRVYQRAYDAAHLDEKRARDTRRRAVHGEALNAYRAVHAFEINERRRSRRAAAKLLNQSQPALKPERK